MLTFQPLPHVSLLILLISAEVHSQPLLQNQKLHVPSILRVNVLVVNLHLDAPFNRTHTHTLSLSRDSALGSVVAVVIHCTWKV